MFLPTYTDVVLKEGSKVGKVEGREISLCRARRRENLPGCLPIIQSFWHCQAVLELWVQMNWQLEALGLPIPMVNGGLYLAIIHCQSSVEQ